MASVTSLVSDTPRVLGVQTPRGPARIHVHPVKRPVAALVLGHGAGGGITAPDLVAVTDAARSHGLTVALVEAPYRVAGRRSPPPIAHLDDVWTFLLADLIAGELVRLPLIVGGRSMGARVACRTADATRATGVICLAFPLRPPRRSSSAPTQSRLSELDAVSVPTLVVQGVRDPFGIPPATGLRTVVEVPGDHSLRSDPAAVASAAGAWLAER